MNKIEVSRANIRSYGCEVEKGAGKLGTAIYNSCNHVGEYYKKADYRANETAMEEFRRTVVEQGIKNVFVSKVRFENGSVYNSSHDNRASFWEYSLKKYDLEEMFENEFEGMRAVKVSLIPQTPIGHIALSKYDADFSGQSKLIEDLMLLDGITLYGELEDYYSLGDGAMEFNYRSDSYTNGDYELEHGSSTYVSDTDDCIYFDGRCSPHNNDVLHEFWNFERDMLDESLKDIDPKETIAVYSRKGKDFYVGYTLESDEISLIWKREDERYEDDDTQEETFSYLFFREDEEKINAVHTLLTEIKKEIENRSYLYNELRIDSYHEVWDYNDDVFDLFSLDLIFNDRNEAKNHIVEILDYDIDIKEASKKANDELIAKHITYNIDMSFVVEELDYFSDKEPIKTKFNQLKIIKRLEKRLHYSLVYSLIGRSQTEYGFAIKQDDEEYHFTLSELLEEATNPIDFVQSCLSSIMRRKLNKLKEFELQEKASRVFVSVEDSYAVGNCEIGTTQFLKRNHIDTQSIGGIRGDALLELENSSFTKNIVAYKIFQNEAQLSA